MMRFAGASGFSRVIRVRVLLLGGFLTLLAFGAEPVIDTAAATPGHRSYGHFETQPLTFQGTKSWQPVGLAFDGANVLVLAGENLEYAVSKIVIEAGRSRLDPIFRLPRGYSYVGLAASPQMIFVLANHPGGDVVFGYRFATKSLEQTWLSWRHYVDF